MTGSEKRATVEMTRAEADRIYAEIGKVRCWLSGFAAGRQHAVGSSPPGADSLRQIQQILRTVKDKPAKPN